MADAPAGVAALFDRVADTYDAVGVEWFGPIGRGLVAELGPTAGERALDIGCGRGAVLFPLAVAVGTTGRVLGIDLAPRMVELTAADASGLEQVELRVADAASPALLPASFDVVASSLVLFFLPDPAAALRTWANLLVPGGRLGVATFGEQDPRWRVLEQLFMPHLPPAMLDARTSGRNGPFASDAGVAALLSGAGLVEVRTAQLTVTPVFDDPEHWLRFSRSHGQRAMWDAVPADQRDRLLREVVDRLEGMRDDDGRIRLTQQARYTLGRRPG
jgi:ubiquinone/menaquinone biosynthesis C-methylase UbiE